MAETPRAAVAVVGLGAILPDAPDVATFWSNLAAGRYSISDVEATRWDPAFYYDPDPQAPDKTYSKIGGWVREYAWDPLGWHLPVPPRVAEQMDEGQRWAINCARAALIDYGWPQRPLDRERTAVILGNALSGEKHYRTALRLSFPEFAAALERSQRFATLPAEVRAAVLAEARAASDADYPEITEDTMPGELGNVLAGRIANLFDLHGPNYICDAACASAMAAMTAGIAGLVDGEYDAVLTGGLDRNMSAPAYIKFCKIGALSATGTRPYGEGADGFVMGEGAAFFLLKRLADAERDGDRVYAVIRGIAGSSDGRGKGITAPNPVGQRLAIERAWRQAGLSPALATMLEGHGTSTRVGDVVEVEAMSRVFGAAGAQPGSIALGSVKSNLGHLKGAAGAAGMLKAVLSLHEKVIPPSLHARTPNPDIDFAASPFRVNHELCAWDHTADDGVRRAGVSAFGFGGTNFHAVIEEHIPGRLDGNGRHAVAVPISLQDTAPVRTPEPTPVGAKAPLRGALVVGAASRAELVQRVQAVAQEAARGVAPPPMPPRVADLRAAERLAVDYADAADLADKLAAALKALAAEDDGGAAAIWRLLRARGIHRGGGPRAKVAFLYTGQGSQYANMLDGLRRAEPVVAQTFAEADRIMQPLLGRPLSEVIFCAGDDAAALSRAEVALRETEITQPAVMAADLALTRLLAAYGVQPDMVMGHSLGEYGALMAAGCLSFEATLDAVSARGREMAHLSVADRGLMAAVLAPPAEIEKVIVDIDGCVVANVNSNTQAVIGGASEPVRTAMDRLSALGYNVVPLPVSHAFHTSIVAPAGAPLRDVLIRLGLRPPRLPIVANATGELYPMGNDVVPEMLDLLSRQIASPVQFVAGLHTLHREGARVFVEVGPKRALQGFAEDVLGAEPGVATLFTNHPKTGDLVSFNQALCGLYAAGLGAGVEDEVAAEVHSEDDDMQPLDQENVVITGAALGLPGRPRVFADDNVAAILDGEPCIDAIPVRLRQAMLDKNITRLVKREDGDPSFEAIVDAGEVIKLAARAGALDLVEEFGVSAERVPALDQATRLAVGCGIDALRDAGIPLVLHYRTTSKGTRLPDHYALPEALRDDTGIIFASAFPGSNALIEELDAYHQHRARLAQLEQLRALRERMAEVQVDAGVVAETERRIRELEKAVAATPYQFDRRFLFRILSMGHSQLAEIIGARGPNTQVNAACASTTQAIALAEDWIRTGRCRRVVVVAADDVTSDAMLEWTAAGFLASGAAATDDVVEQAALPFDRRRHGMLLGMGAAALVVESAQAARERGIAPICEVLAAVSANSAYHGTRLDVQHITQVMESLVQRAESAGDFRREEAAGELLFMSHETYTPARGGSASAEVEALRSVFGARADSVVVANTKGFTGHPMGVGIEDVVAVKALETGVVPPVPNFKEVDPELGTLRLSKGGAYPVRYALRLAAGFGSQVGMALLRWTPTRDGLRRPADELGYAYRIVDRVAWAGWLSRIAKRPDVELEVVRRTLRVREDVQVQPAAVQEPVPEPGPTPQPTPQPSPVPEPNPQPAPQPSPQPAPEAASAPPIDADAVRLHILDVVAEKTGYPQDMLDPDLDLEADLGVDTVKQAEIFAMVRESYGIPRDDTVRLRDFPTLAHVVRFVVDRAQGNGAAASSASAHREEVTEPVPEPSSVPRPLPDWSQADTVPRRVPVPVPRPPLDACAPTAVRLGGSTRVLVGGDRDGVAPALVARLRALGVSPTLLDTDADEESFAATLRDAKAAGPVHGVYWLPGLDVEPPLQAMDSAAWRSHLRRRVKLLYETLRAVDPPDQPGAFVMAATALGGRHGYDDAGATAPMGGAVAGFVKAFARERPATLCKVVDHPVHSDPEQVAAHLVAETLADPTVVEVGHHQGARWTIGLREQPAADGGPGLQLGPQSVVLITGAAGGIVSAITADLAAASGGVFHLLDLTPEPDEQDPDLARVVSDRDGLKRDLVERLRGQGERPTPAMVERRLLGLERQAAALAAIRAVREAGGSAVYHAVDLTDAEAVSAVVGQIIARHQRVDVLLHAAGMESSHMLADKEPAEFDRVFDVKADGYFHLLSALGDAPLQASVVFSSVAGRFGNAGQTDYSAANDLLCKLTSHLRRVRPATRAVAVDWTAWGEIGMATRGSIPKMMELAGIEMLRPQAGVPTVRRELCAGGRSGEVVVAGRLGVLLEERTQEPPAPADRAPRHGALRMQLLDAPLHGATRIAVDLDATRQPFLDHHRIDGVPVLPGVMGVECFAEAASLALPGWRVVAVEDVDFAAPFKLYRDQPRQAVVEVEWQVDGDAVVADCRLLGSRTLVGQETPQLTEHFRGRVRLQHDAGDEAHMATAHPQSPAHAVGAADVYRVYFHGPAYQVLDSAWRDADGVVGLMAAALPPDHDQDAGDFATLPRLLELAFQTAGVAELGTTGSLALPAHLDAVHIHAAPTQTLLHAVVQGNDAQVVDAAGRVLVDIHGYRTTPLPLAIPDDLLAPFRRAMQAGHAQATGV